MATLSYHSKTGEQLWKVYVNVRSKSDPAVRAQRRVSGCKSQREAEREEVKLIRECEREIAEKEALGSSWGNVVESWQAHLEKDRAQSMDETTRMDYVAALRNHTQVWWKRSAAEITKMDVREALNQMKAQGYSKNFQKKVKNVVNQVFIYGIESNLVKGIDRSPGHGIQIEKTEESKPEILTVGEIRKLLTEARRYNHPWYPIWSLALLTGMRSGELYALLWTDIDWDNKEVSVNKSYSCRFRRVKSTKAGYWRTVPVSSELIALLGELKAQAGTRPEVLPRLWQWTQGLQAQELRKFCLGVGLPSIRFHALRACFATQLIRNGVPPIQIQKICGWKDLSTMQRYIRMAGIEVEGATEGLKLLPEGDVSAQVVNLFTREPVTPGVNP